MNKGELGEISTVKEYLTVQTEGQRNVVCANFAYTTQHDAIKDKTQTMYNLDAIIYTCASPQGINVNNPVQAVGAARGKRNSSVSELRRSSTPDGVAGKKRWLSTPSCASLARGYSRSSPFGLADDKIIKQCAKFAHTTLKPIKINN